jgi:hypothetical protein
VASAETALSLGRRESGTGRDTTARHGNTRPAFALDALLGDEVVKRIRHGG